MSLTEKHSMNEAKNLESIISNAIVKVGGRNQSDLCKYLPINAGGYMHHFTLQKLKTQAPEQLSELIMKYIVKVDKPVALPPKRRVHRGYRKKRDQFIFDRQDIEKILNLAKLAGDKEIIKKLSPKQDLKAIKRRLISSIKNGNADGDLWNAYVDAVSILDTASASSSLKHK